MRIYALTGAILLVSACATAEPPTTPAGAVEVNGITYPLVSLANGTWRAYVDGTPVICSKPSETACYWSVRNYLQSRELLDDLG